MFIRVKDKSTGHEFDVPESDPRIGKSLHRANKANYPPSASVRRPKHNVGRSPAPVRNTQPSTETESTEEESENE